MTTISERTHAEVRHLLGVWRNRRDRHQQGLRTRDPGKPDVFVAVKLGISVATAQRLIVAADPACRVQEGDDV